MKLASILFAVFVALPPAWLADQSKDIEHHATVKPSQRIVVTGLSGAKIDFKTWDKDEVYLKLSLRISSSDDDYEREYVDSFEVEERTTDGNLVLAFKEPRRDFTSGIWSIFKGGSYVRKEITGEIYVPAANPLTTDLSYGSLSITGIKGELNVLGKNNTLFLKDCAKLRQITNNYGKTEIEDGGGVLDFSGTSSTVEITKFAGPATVDAKYSAITIASVEGAVKVESQSGSHTIEDIGGNLTIRSKYSTMSVSNIRGLLDITSQSGSVKARNVQGLVVDAPYTNIDVIDVTGMNGKDVTIADQSATITLENVSGNTIVRAPYSTVELKNIQGSVDVETKSGTVKANSVTGNWKSRTEYSRMDLMNLRSNEIMMTNKSGNIDVDLLVVPASIDIRNEYARVDVRLPKGFSGDISLDAEYGAVRTDFAIQTRNRSSSGYAVGKVGSGTGKIAIETRSGDIELTQK